MASGIALGGLAQGLSQGLQSGISLGKALIEKDKYELERPELELKADMSKRKTEAMRQTQSLYNDWMKANTMDADGNPLPPEQQPNELLRRTAFFNINHKAMLDNGALDADQLLKMAQVGNNLKKENTLAAIDTYYREGPEAALKMWNSTGQKAPEGTTLRPFTDEGGMRDVAIIGPDGNQIGTFQQALFFMSADNVAKYTGEAKIEKMRGERAEKVANIGAGATIQSALINKEASMANNANNNAAAMDRTLAEGINRLAVAQLGVDKSQDPIFRQIKDTLVSIADSRLRSGLMTPQQQQAVELEMYNTGSLAYNLMRTGKASDVLTAIAMAKKQRQQPGQ